MDNEIKSKKEIILNFVTVDIVLGSERSELVIIEVRLVTQPC